MFDLRTACDALFGELLLALKFVAINLHERLVLSFLKLQALHFKFNLPQLCALVIIVEAREHLPLRDALSFTGLHLQQDAIALRQYERNLLDSKRRRDQEIAAD